MNGYRNKTVCVSRSNSLRLLFVGLNSEVHKRDVATPDELLAGILDYAAARIKKREDQLRPNNTRTSHSSCEVR